MTDAIPVKRRDATSLGEFESADRAPMRFLQLPKGYIDGLKMEWVSGTSLRVTSGAAYVVSLNRVMEVPAAITKAGLSLAASTWYHVYLFDNAGVADIEVVTTAPAAPFSGTAKSKSGDASRRYVGSIKTDASAAVMNFVQTEIGRIIYRLPSGAAPQAVLVAGVATTVTAVSCAAVVPVTASTATTTIVNNANLGSNMRVFESNGTYGPTGSLYGVTPNGTVSADMPLNSSQEFQYYMTSPPSSGGGNVHVTGYFYER